MANVTPPNTNVATSHAVVIKAGSPLHVIGAIHQWNASSMSRGGIPLYELGVDTPGGGPYGGTPVQYSRESGEPFEIVPGNVSGQEISVGRYDIYTKPMEDVFYTSRLESLAWQKSALEVLEQWTKPDNTTMFTQYRGCWFTKLGRTVTADDARVIKADATLVYTQRTFWGAGV